MSRKKHQVTITLKTDVLRLIRHAARFWRQRLKTFIRLAIEFRAGEVSNSGPSVMLPSQDMRTFHRIYQQSKDPGTLERKKRGRKPGSSSGIVPDDWKP